MSITQQKDKIGSYVRVLLRKFKAVMSKVIKSKRNSLLSFLVRFLAFIRRLIILFIVLSVIIVLCFRWIPPPTSSVMLQENLKRFFLDKDSPPIRYKWVDWKSISSYMPIAVVAAEDQKFSQHWGFDFEAIFKAVDSNERGGRLRGGSTITQQVAKNLFLWQDRSYLRKAFEAYFTILLELCWSKNRILEVYMNIVEFGDGIYGVSSASKIFMNKPPSKLTKSEAALLASVLPNPKRFKVKRPTPYMNSRKRWIERQTKQLGGKEYLRGL